MDVHPLVAELTDLRKQQRIDRSWVAAQLGVKPSRLKDWESGEVEPSMPHLRVWAGALGRDVAVQARDGDGDASVGAVAAILKARRHTLGWSQERVAHAFGAGSRMSQSNVAALERRDHLLKVSTATRWAHALDCDLVLVCSMRAVAA